MTNYTTEDNNKTTLCCCRRYIAELCSTSFFPATDGTGKVLDMEKSLSFFKSNNDDEEHSGSTDDDGSNDNNNAESHRNKCANHDMKMITKFLFLSVSLFTFIHNWVI